MDTTRFDRWTRSLTDTSSRRTALGFVAALGLAASGLPSAAEAKKKKKAATPLNQFGCLDVGAKCRGKSALCCSGICQGKKPKPGKKDKSVCVAHNDGGCTPARSQCVTSSPVASNCNPASVQAVCFATTGNAGFCADTSSISPPESTCRDCTTDTDCEAFGFGAGSACVVLQGGPACDPVCPVTGGRACLPPGI